LVYMRATVFIWE